MVNPIISHCRACKRTSWAPILGTLMLWAVSACSSIPQINAPVAFAVAVPTSAPTGGINAFTLHGRLALRVPTPEGVQAHSVRLYWQERDSTTRLILETTLGVGVAEIQRPPNPAQENAADALYQLRLANGSVGLYPSLEAVLFSAVGAGQIAEPITAPFPRGSIKSLITNSPMSLPSAGWQIKSDYPSVSSPEKPSFLPERLTIENANTRIVVWIDAWSDVVFNRD